MAKSTKINKSKPTQARPKGQPNEKPSRRSLEARTRGPDPPRCALPQSPRRVAATMSRCAKWRVDAKWRVAAKRRHEVVNSTCRETEALARVVMAADLHTLAESQVQRGREMPRRPYGHRLQEENSQCKGEKTSLREHALGTGIVEVVVRTGPPDKDTVSWREWKASPG